MKKGLRRDGEIAVHDRQRIAEDLATESWRVYARHPR
jgi:hypothetical protein